MPWLQAADALAIGLTRHWQNHHWQCVAWWRLKFSVPLWSVAAAVCAAALCCSLDSMVAHMQEEEQTMLPQLSAVLDVETQLRLGILFEAAKVNYIYEPCTVEQ